MRWVKRGLWLTAWGCWVWAGFRLERELPRDEAPVLCRATIQKETVLGLVGEGKMLATCRLTGPSADRIAVRVRRVCGTEILHERIFTFNDLFSFQFSRHHGVVVGETFDGAGRGPATGAFDLCSGRWAKLAAPGARVVQFHREHPWVLLAFPNVSEGLSVIVADVRTGRRIFAWPPSHGPARRLVGSPIFRADGATLLVPTVTTTPGGLADRDTFEVWRLDRRSAAPELELASVRFDATAVDAASGRAAWADLGTDPVSVRVFDTSAGRIVFSHPPNARLLDEINFIGSPPSVVLAPDGRGVLFEDALWSVDSGAALWKRGPHESVDRLAGGAGTFAVEEAWDRVLGGWAGRFATWAARDLSTGAVVFRLWTRDERGPALSEDMIDEAQHIRVDLSGAFHTYPPAPNYPLLAFCQTILALPFALTWLALRLRRNRRLRAAGAAA